MHISNSEFWMNALLLPPYQCWFLLNLTSMWGWQKPHVVRSGGMTCHWLNCHMFNRNTRRLCTFAGMGFHIWITRCVEQRWLAIPLSWSPNLVVSSFCMILDWTLPFSSSYSNRMHSELQGSWRNIDSNLVSPTDGFCSVLWSPPTRTKCRLLLPQAKILQIVCLSDLVLFPRITQKSLVSKSHTFDWWVQCQL